MILSWFCRKWYEITFFHFLARKFTFVQWVTIGISINSLNSFSVWYSDACAWSQWLIINCSHYSRVNVLNRCNDLTLSISNEVKKHSVWLLSLVIGTISFIWFGVFGSHLICSCIWAGAFSAVSVMEGESFRVDHFSVWASLEENIYLVYMSIIHWRILAQNNYAIIQCVDVVNIISDDSLDITYSFQ